MTIRSAICPLAVVSAMTAAMPALAAPECLANGKAFRIGQTACLTIAGESHLARCDMVLNNTSWTKIENSCQSGAPGQRPETDRISTPPRPPADPSEPVED